MGSGRRGMTAAVALICGGAVGPVLAQTVTDVQVSPPQVRLKAGEQTRVSATAYAQDGNVVVDARLRWSATDSNIVRVVIDTMTPEIVTLVGVGTGSALVEARSGVARGFAMVEIGGGAPRPAGGRTADTTNG